MSETFATRDGAKKDTRSYLTSSEIKFGSSFFATLMTQFREPRGSGMVQGRVVFSLVRKREAWNIVLKKKAEALSMRCPQPVQEVPPRARINRYKGALVFRDPRVCVCGLSAHPYMTLQKKRWEVEVIGKSFLGYADPYRVLQETPLS